MGLEQKLRANPVPSSCVLVALTTDPQQHGETCSFALLKTIFRGEKKKSWKPSLAEIKSPRFFAVL